MIQEIIVGVILLLTAVLTVRWVVRTLRGKGRCGCAGCPHSGGKECHCCDHTPRIPDIEL